MYIARGLAHVWACLSATDWKMALDDFQVAVASIYLLGSKRIQHPVFVQSAPTVQTHC